MPFLINDFKCTSCEHEWEEMWFKPSEPEDPEKPWVGEVQCPKCEAGELERLCSASGVAAFSAMSPERQREHLKNRSAKHSRKLMKTNRDELQHKMDKGKSKVMG